MSACVNHIGKKDSNCCACGDHLVMTMIDQSLRSGGKEMNVEANGKCEEYASALRSD